MYQDNDFIGFTFNGKHSIKDLKIYRTSDGSRYNENLSPDQDIKTEKIKGSNGTHLSSVKFKQKPFNINFAFDNLYEEDIRQLKRLFAEEGEHELSFDERPYIVYDVVVKGTPQLKSICFDEIRDGKMHRVYKGEGTVQFIAYYPYGHTPTHLFDAKGNFIETDGRLLKNYNTDWYSTKKEWAEASYLSNDTFEIGLNKGHVSAPFVININGEIKSGRELVVGAESITINQDCTGLKWSSRTGAVLDGSGAAVDYSGNSLAKIPIAFTPIDIDIGLDATIEYQWWYY